MFRIKNIEYILFCYKDLIIFKNLKINNSFRGRLGIFCSFHYKNTSMGFTINSASFPDFDITNLYLNGNDRYLDGKVVCYNFKSLKRDYNIDINTIAKIYKAMFDYINTMKHPATHFDIRMNSDYEVY